MAATKTRYRKSEALKKLEQQVYERKLQSSSMPSYAVVRTKFDDRTANDLTACIISYLTLLGGWASRINTTGRYLHGQEVTNVLGHIQRTRGKWIPGSTQKGTPDIIGNRNGVFLGIEVKIGRDRLSDKQQQVQNQINQSGGIYIVARSFVQFTKQLGELYFSKREKSIENKLNQL